MTKVITVFNQKGGSGKTHVVVNLATYFAYHGLKTLVIDLDSQCDCTWRLLDYMERDERAKYSDNINNVERCFILDMDLPIVQTKYCENLFVVPGSEGLLGLGYSIYASTVAGSNYSVLTAIRRHLKPIKHLYDVIIIDTPPDRISPMVTNALIASTHLLIPVSVGSPQEWENLKHAFNKHASVALGDSNTHSLEVLGIVFNKVGDNASTRRAHQYVNDFLGNKKNLLERYLFKNHIKYYVEFQSAGLDPMKPMIFQSTKKPAAKNFMLFYNEVKQRLNIN